MPALGAGGREFESRLPDNKKLMSQLMRVSKLVRRLGQLIGSAAQMVDGRQTVTLLH